jgi:hypothetical protein
MSPSARQTIAERMRLLLMQQVGHAIDVARVQTDARYARDVLLVCDAHPGSELAELARQFRGLGVSARPRPSQAGPPQLARALSHLDLHLPPRLDALVPLPDADRLTAPAPIERIEPTEPRQAFTVEAPMTHPGAHALGDPGWLDSASWHGDAAGARHTPPGVPAGGAGAPTVTAQDPTARVSPGRPPAGSPGNAHAERPVRPGRGSRFGITLTGPSQFLHSLFGATRSSRHASPETAPPSQFDPEAQTASASSSGARRWPRWRSR